MSYVTSRSDAPRRRRIQARLGATLLAMLLVAGLPACDALDPDELIGAHNKNQPGDPTATSLKPVTITPNEEWINAVGHTRQLQATVLNPAGKPRKDAVVTWRSLNPGVATVDSKGKVTAVATGLALITATSGGRADTAQVEVQQVVAEVTLTPASATLAPGGTVQLVATATDSNSVKVPDATFSWSSALPEIARVDASGRVTKLAEGTVTITAIAAPHNVSAISTISGSTAPPPPPPPPSGSWDRVLADTIVRGHVVVPDGQRWLIGRNVQIAGNLRTVNGTIAMRPGSSLKFLGADPAKYVGGGMHYTDAFANDIGLWVGGHGARGVLDIQCTPKTSWNRAGVDPTWGRDDEYWIAPTAPGDFAPRRWYPGQRVPQIHPRVPPTEVMNVTRDCVIHGPGHIHIHSSVPQRIEYVQLRQMGVIVPGLSDSGRYALHIHMMGEASRGTIVRGVAAVHSGGRVFVPHASHGVTMIDNVSVNSMGEALWWDQNGREDRTNDILVDRLAVSGVHIPRAITGRANRTNGIELAMGDNMTIRNSAVSGTQGGKLGVGFNWSSRGVREHSLWTFDEGNVAHNNTGPGLRFWTNSRFDHPVKNFISYRNGAGGIENGAYRNGVRYFDALLVEDNIHHLTSSVRVDKKDPDGRGNRYERVKVYSRSGPALTFANHNLPGDAPAEFIDCVLEAGPGAPKVLVRGRLRNPLNIVFRRCGILPADIVFEDLSSDGLQGSSIVIENEDGARWETKVLDAKRVDKSLP